MAVATLEDEALSSPTERVTRDGVRRALRSALERAHAWQLARVAIPPFGLGAGNLEFEVSAQLLADELVRHTRDAAFPTEVTIVAETSDEAALLTQFLARSAE